MDEEEGVVVVGSEAVSYSVVFIDISSDGFHAIIWVHGLTNPFREEPSN